MENHHWEWVFPWKIVIFHSYVSLPEGISFLALPSKAYQERDGGCGCQASTVWWLVFSALVGLGSRADWLKGMQKTCPFYVWEIGATLLHLHVSPFLQVNNILCFDCSWERASTKRGCWKFLRSSLASNGHGFRGEGCGLSKGSQWSVEGLSCQRGYVMGATVASIQSLFIYSIKSIIIYLNLDNVWIL